MKKKTLKLILKVIEEVSDKALAAYGEGEDPNYFHRSNRDFETTRILARRAIAKIVSQAAEGKLNHEHMESLLGNGNPWGEEGTKKAEEEDKAYREAEAEHDWRMEHGIYSRQDWD